MSKRKVWVHIAPGWFFQMSPKMVKRWGCAASVVPAKVMREYMQRFK